MGELTFPRPVKAWLIYIARISFTATSRAIMFSLMVEAMSRLVSGHVTFVGLVIS